MFQHIVQHLDYFDKERRNTLTKGTKQSLVTIKDAELWKGVSLRYLLEIRRKEERQRR